jgi:hypothetical protein
MQIRNIFILLALLLLSVTVYAGYKQPAPVTIEYYEGGGIAGGDLNAARYSDNEFEFIGCGIRASDNGAGGVFDWGFCQASLEEEVTVTCFVIDDPALMEGINVLSDSSYVTFSWDDDGEGNLTCNRVGASTQSFYLRKAQKAK